MKHEQTISWSAIITYIEPNGEQHQAYAIGDTLAQLKEDALRVYNGLKVAGRTPLKILATQKLQKTFEFEEDDGDFWKSVGEESMIFTVICPECGEVYHNPDEELNQGINCPDCGAKVR
jgi:DNA-directed RNA polymerase subunit RPC12/RpoP